MKNRTIKSLTIMVSIFTMAACGSSKQLMSDSSFFDNSKQTSSKLTLNAVKQLRSPEGLPHSVSYEETTENGYLAFKDRLTTFSHELSESFVKRYFEDGKNITISPLSVELCLGLSIRCANGQTRKELLDVLDVDYETFNEYYSRLFNQNNYVKMTNTGDLMSEMLLTNSIWIDDRITLLDRGLDALRDDYYCYSYEADFASKNKETNAAISNFINDKTRGLIKPDLQLSPDTLFVLMNTLYLKDIWDDCGSELSYSNNPDYFFTNSNQTKSNKQLLLSPYIEGRAIETEDYSSFYTSTINGFRIQFIKPNNGKNIRNILTKETMNDVLDPSKYIHQDDTQLERYYTRCVFPEYVADGDIDLTKIFKEDFNVQSLFNADCDFSNITDKSVFCSDFKQIAKLEVNKKGIEGAAVTYMAFEATSVPSEPKHIIYEDFLVNKEFGFILTKNDTVLFSGVVTNIDK